MDGLSAREAAGIAARLERLVPYHLDLGRKYDRAGCQSWLPVAPGPPEPE